MLTWARYHARRMVYRNTVLRRLAEQHTSTLDSADWDQHLASDKIKYLGGTVSIDARNSLIATLVRHYGSQRPAVLDVGCAGGSLAVSIDYEEYLGTDISSVAIARARLHYGALPQTQFQVSALEEFDLSNRAWDIIVLGEVLYYLSVEKAVEQVSRYANALTPCGLICISMKDDGKSHQILRLLHFLTLQEAILMQAKTEPECLDYRIRVNRERPAYLIAAFTEAQSNWR
jgi:2-polyprenyl-3-methyl-5-hydroxy-6-metoxy-1,4-benzoquinol methylase